MSDETAVGMPVMQGVWERRNNQGIQIVRVHYSADPDRDPERNPDWFRTERKKYSSQGVWDREQEIIYEAGGGERLFSNILSKYKHKILITDPLWRPNPYWRVVGGFDHGKRNPTAGLVVYVDEDRTLYACGEYYMPGLGPRQNAENLRMLPGFYQSQPVFADPSIFYETQAQPDGSYKSLNQLYVEAGLTNMCAAAQNDELTGMERILDHWHNGDLDDKEPTLKIVCRMSYEKRRDGLYPYDCPNLLWELMRTRREELTAQQLMRRNPTEKIVDKDNHCFIAGTLITTERGEVPIESVRCDDRVLTRRGWASVESAWMTRAAAAVVRIQFSNNSELICTDNHPIFVPKMGFVAAGELREGMKGLCLKTAPQKSFDGWASDFIDTLRAQRSTCGGILETVASTCINWSGYSRTVAQSLKAIIFIIATKIHCTTIPLTWKLFLHSIISVGTVKPRSAGRKNSQRWNSPAKQLRHGTGLLKAELGIACTAQLSERVFSRLRRSVSCAASALRIAIAGGETSFAVATAEVSGAETLGLTISSAPANGAVRPSQSTSTPKRSTAQRLAEVAVSSVERLAIHVPVYNLTVRDCPEYFANGILVHNCRDALKYIVLSLPKAAEVPIEHKIAMATKDMNSMNQFLTAQKMLAQERQLSKPIITGGTALRRGVGLGKFGRR